MERIQVVIEKWTKHKLLQQYPVFEHIVELRQRFGITRPEQVAVALRIPTAKIESMLELEGYEQTITEDISKEDLPDGALNKTKGNFKPR